MARRRPINPANISLNVNDILSRYGDPDIGKAILKNLVEQGPLGVGQVLRLEERDIPTVDPSGATTGTRRALQVVFNQTGQAFDSLEEAMDIANSRGVVSYSRLSKNPANIIGRQLPFGGVHSDMRTINMVIKRAKLNPSGKEAKDLRKLGLGQLIDDAEVTTRNGQRVLSEFLEIRPSTVKVPLGGRVQDYLANFTNPSGSLMGTLLEGDEGFTFYQYSFPNKGFLDQDQILKLRAYVGLPEVDTQTLIDSLGKGVSDKGIESKIMKIGKRQKGTYSPRQVSVTEKGLSTFLRAGFTNIDDFAESVLAVDTRAELLLAGLSSKSTNTQIKTRLAAAYNNLDYNFYNNLDIATQEAIGNFDEIFGKSIKQSDYNKLASILDGVKGKANITSEFEKAIKNSNLSQNVKDRVGVLLSKMEVEVDGALRGSKEYFDKYASSLQKTFDRLNTKKQNLTATESEIRRLDDIHKTLKSFARLDDNGKWVTDESIYGMTARVNFKKGTQTPQVKGRLGFVDEIVTKSGKRYAFLTPDVNIKKETSLAQGIFLDVLGRDKGIEKIIAPDIQSLIQYSSSFLDVDPLTGTASVPKVTQMYIQQQLQEMQEVLSSKIVPLDVIDSILQKMETSTEAAFNETYKASKRGAQLTHQMAVKEMRDALLGGRWQNDPQVLNAIFNEYISRTYTVKSVQSSGRTKTFVIPKTPDLFRFDIESEASSLMGTDTPRLLLGKRDTEIVRMGAGTNDISLPVTRISHHRMLFSSMNSVRYQASHGGFDFDDKGMPSIRSYVDTGNGERRLALFAFRQPPSIGEYTVQSFLKDQETLQAMFGKNEKFMSNLRMVAEDDDEAAELLRYMEMNPTDKKSGREFAKLHAKFAGIQVSDADINAGRYYGSASSKLLKADDAVFRGGQVQADRVLISAYERTYNAGPTELPEFAIRALAKTGGGSPLVLDKKAFQSLTTAEQLEAAPHYIQGRVFRLFADSKEVPFSAEERSAIDAVMNRYGISSTITPTMAEDPYRKGLSDVYNNLLNNIDTGRNRAALAEMNAIASKYKLRLTMSEGEGILGSYINTLTALGSSVEQFDDIVNNLRGSNMGQLADAIDRHLAAFMVGSESAIDFTKAAGGMTIRGISNTQQSNIVVKALADAAAVYGDMIDQTKLAAELANLGVTNINEAGTLNIANLGRRIGFMRTAGEMFGIEEMRAFGVDPTLVQRSLSGKRALEALHQGIMSGADIALSQLNNATADQKALGEGIRTQFEALERNSKELQSTIALAANSRYAGLSIQTTYGKLIQSTIGAISREQLLIRKSSDIDAFFYRRQKGVMPTDIVDMAERIVDDFKADFDQIQSFVNSQKQDLGGLTSSAQAREQLAKIDLAQKYEQQIQEGVEELKRVGYSNIEDIDLADAIAYAGRVKKVGRASLEDFVTGSDPRNVASIRTLFSDADLRRRYTMLATSNDFKTSEAYKLQQIMDRALGKMGPTARTRVEEQLTDSVSIMNFLRRIADKPSSIRPRKNVAGATVSELVNGIMSIDDFNRLVGKSTTAVGAGAVGSFADQDFGILNLTGAGRSAREEYQKIYDDIASMSTADELDLFNNEVRYAEGLVGDLNTLYNARARGFEGRYLTSSGDVVLPTLTNTRAGMAGVTQAIQGQKYKRLSTLIEDGTIRNLMQKPYVQGASLAIAGLAAFGLIYSAAKDRTPEDMQGPPLLPGGSAYETAYPGNTLNLPIPQDLLASNQNGVTYKVNVSGNSENARRFSEAARSMSSGSSSINYYNNIPNLSKDPYKQIGESF